jgi:hypothetical protein
MCPKPDQVEEMVSSVIGRHYLGSLDPAHPTSGSPAQIGCSHQTVITVVITAAFCTSWLSMNFSIPVWKPISGMVDHDFAVQPTSAHAVSAGMLRPHV